MARRTIHDVVGSFGIARGGVFVTFTHQAAEFLVQRDNPRIGAIVGALADSWAKKTTVALVINGVTIVDLAEERQ